MGHYHLPGSHLQLTASEVYFHKWGSFSRDFRLRKLRNLRKVARGFPRDISCCRPA